ncbi:hypothetical protein JK361_32905 [Streptomyces sp. 5-8]|uniref:Uncharacterized protein n=1 Tax=Streptomyces musisoli TaxID=2802280 RepID=A0ABS1PAD1_9ACTN|nr:hypothetical protein [Streptomyces musisoli]MBL1109336.1 hypothetical protein [Streptomyces musisoli]
MTTGRHRIRVGVFTPAESLAYLTRAPRTHTESDEQLAGPLTHRRKTSLVLPMPRQDQNPSSSSNF